MKKILLTSLIFIFVLLTLSSCGNPIADEPNSHNTTESHFTLSLQALPGSIVSSTSQISDGESVYICGRELNETPVLGKFMKTEFDEYYVPDNISYLHACCKAGDNLVVVAGDFPEGRYDATGQYRENKQERYALYLLTYDNTGELIEQIPVDLLDESGINIRSIQYLNGYFYLLSPNTFVQLDSKGNIKDSLHLDSFSFISQCIYKEKITVCYYDIGEGITKISLISPEVNLQFEDIFSDASMTISGIGTSDKGDLLIIGNNAIHVYTQKNNELQEIYDFYKSGVLDTEYVSVFSISENYILDRPFQKNITGLTYGEIVEKEPLLLWTHYVDKYLEKLVSGFNQTHSDYQIQVENVGNVEESQLNARIISGDGPDLYYTGSTEGFGSLSSDAVFEDLFPFIQASEQVCEENLIMPLIESVNDGNEIFIFPVNFVLYTAVCWNGFIPVSSLSLSEINMLPQVQNGDVSIFPSYFSATDVWYWLSNLYVCKYLDKERAVCNFKTDEFIELLEFCTTIDETPQEQDIPSIFSFEWIPGTLRMLYYQETFGESFELNTAFGSGFGVEMAFAISNTSERKDGAWKFIEYCHVADIAGERFSLPASATRLEQLLNEARNSGIWWEERQQYIPLSNYTIDELEKAIYGTKNQFANDDTILKIVEEEANKFFAGDKSAEDTVEIIQSRVNIFLAEQYG
ncbi:MAG: extracellular solute-binding protein [Candidatus Limivicinus sp.]